MGALREEGLALWMLYARLVIKSPGERVSQILGQYLKSVQNTSKDEIGISDAKENSRMALLWVHEALNIYVNLQLFFKFGVSSESRRTH